jgi:periplasmic divalent cation tolerance protein
MSEVSEVRSSFPDAAAATVVAHQLVSERLGACAHVGEPHASVYRWQGDVVSEPEVELRVITAPARAEATVARILALHPYELPAVTVASLWTTPEYAAWALEATTH